MIKFKIIVPFEEGLHARPAAQLVSLIKNIKSEVSLRKDSNSVNPKSILGVLSVGAGYNDEVEFIIEGEDEEAVAKSIKQSWS